jgi:hypothetical protein
MDELDILAETLRRDRFLTVLRKIIVYKKESMRTTSITSLLGYNADVDRILEESRWTVEEFREYYKAYHKALKPVLDKELEKKKNDSKSN